MGQLSQTSLIESEEKYRRLFESSLNGLLLLNAKTGAITDVNPFLIKMLGFTRKELIQQKFWEAQAFLNFKTFKDSLKTLREDESLRFDNFSLQAKNGRIYQVEFNFNSFIASSQKFILCNIRDMTEHVEAKNDLEKSEAFFREQSVRDYLTGLFNRRYLEETLERELTRSSRHQLNLGIIMLDVDDFKSFNDTWGHAVGDKVLNEFGKILLKSIRREDIACRFGGDEFIIVLPEASESVTFERAKLISRSSKQLQYLIAHRKFVPITISIGVATFPRDGFSRVALLRSVDSALYSAKREGRGQIRLTG